MEMAYSRPRNLIFRRRVQDSICTSTTKGKDSCTAKDKSAAKLVDKSGGKGSLEQRSPGFSRRRGVFEHSVLSAKEGRGDNVRL